MFSIGDPVQVKNIESELHDCVGEVTYLSRQYKWALVGFPGVLQYPVLLNVEFLSEPDPEPLPELPTDAPLLTITDSGILNWNKVAEVTTYQVSIRTQKSETFRLVTSLKEDAEWNPKDQFEGIAYYKVRTLVDGSNWSNEVSFDYGEPAPPEDPAAEPKNVRIAERNDKKAIVFSQVADEKEYVLIESTLPIDMSNGNV